MNPLQIEIVCDDNEFIPVNVGYNIGLKFKSLKKVLDCITVVEAVVKPKNVNSATAVG